MGSARPTGCRTAAEKHPAHLVAGQRLQDVAERLHRERLAGRTCTVEVVDAEHLHLDARSGGQRGQTRRRARDHLSRPAGAIAGAPLLSLAVLLTITTTHRPATDLGFLLHKHPDRVQQLRAAVRRRRTSSTRRRPTSAARRRCCSTSTRSGWCGAGAAARASRSTEYVNDRPVRRLVVPERRASSRSSARALAGTLQGAPGAGARRRSRSRRGSPSVPGARRRGRSLRAAVRAARLRRRRAAATRSTSASPSGATSRYLHAAAARRRRVCATCSPTSTCCMPGARRRQALLGRRRRGREAAARAARAGWPAHPERDLIARRYLKHQREPVRATALGAARAEEDRADAEERRGATTPSEEARRGARSRLNDQRLGAVAGGAARRRGARRVLDLGCGEGKLLRGCSRDRRSSEIVGLDVSCARARDRARGACKLDRLPRAPARADRAAPRLADLPRPAPRRLRRGGRRRGRSSTSTRRGWRRSSASCSSSRGRRRSS